MTRAQAVSRAALAALAAAAAAAVGVLVLAAPGYGDEPWWHLSAGARPSVLPGLKEAGGKLVPGVGEIVLTAENVGDANATAGEASGALHGPIRLLDELPAGLRALAIAGSEPAYGGALGATVPLSCSLEEVACETSAAVAPFDALEVRIEVEVLPQAKSGEENVFAVYGGGAAGATLSRPIGVDGPGVGEPGMGAPGEFGVQEYGLSVEAEGGGTVTRAGSHPYQVTGTIALTQGPDAGSLTGVAKAGPAAPAKDITAQLPPGLVADPGVVPRCQSWQFTAVVPGGEQDECPYQSAVGAASVTFNTAGGVTRTLAVPVFDLEPEAGEPARFGFFLPIVDVPVTLASSVRSGPGEDWGVDLTSASIPQTAGISSVRLTFWGVPGRGSHDESRGWGCLAATRGRGAQAYEGCVHVEEETPPAFITLPSACQGPLSSSLQADSWSEPGVYRNVPSEELPGMSDCGQLGFSPAISTQPSTQAAASPSGLAFDLTFATEGLTSGEGTAQSDLADTSVELPEGLTIDPSAGVGLGSCTPAEYAAATLSSPAAVGCPEDSKLGTVEIETPLLLTPIYGSLYVATPYDNPFSEPGHPNGSFIALYVIARSRAERGILVKLAGMVTANPVTGRLSVSFEGDPPLPFAKFNFHFREGAQAALITPPTCGTYTTSAQLTPYAAPENPLLDEASFQITAGSEGTSCPGATLPFAPHIAAGTLTEHAGTFSPLYFELARSDAMSEIASFATSLPVGVTANLTGVPFCPEANIQLARSKTGVQEEAEPSCPAASLIGHSLVGTGVGQVLDYVPGKLYLAGPFHGDPFSVVSVTSAVVGPFDLGTIVIRFGLAINPYTAQVSISPTGSEPIPTIIDGIVTHVRNIRVSIDRPDFTLNPTSCAAQPITSSLQSNLGQSSTTSTTLQATGCNELAFKPTFKASTSARTSHINGASLSVKLSMPVKLGTESNIREVKVSLPEQLPARLPTLQQACTEAQFNRNPAGCPKGSFVGSGSASTPIIPVPLTGPAIFVSHGGEEFPSLVLLLQGYGVTVDLVGSTFVNGRTGVISTTFKAVPDEPVGSFTLTLPEGPYSAVAANANLCKVTRTVTVKRKVTVRSHGRRRTVTRRVAERVKAGLQMPTLFIAQNGQTIHRNTPIAVDGCHTTSAKRSRRRRHADHARRRGTRPKR